MLEKYKNVLVYAAHPDDLELSCGGTVARLCKQKDTKVTLKLRSTPFSEERLEYIENASKILGYDLFPELDELDPRRLELQSMRNEIKYLTSDLGTKGYDLLITHWKEDWHQEHRECYDIARSAVRKSGCDVWYMQAVPYFTRYEQFKKNVLVSIPANSVDKKELAIEEHENVPHDWIDLTHNIGRIDGYSIGRNYAECFMAEKIISY